MTLKQYTPKREPEIKLKKEAFEQNKRKIKAKAKKILALLDEHYPDDGICFLEYEKPWQLLISTILAAQCTDARVNIVTRGLFKKYPDIKDFANANREELEQDIKSTGFYKNKAKSIIGAMDMLRKEYNGVLPNDIDKLLKFPGVGRKTANVYLGRIHNIPAIVVDTHVKRISGKLGLTYNTDPEKIEYDLMDILPKEHWIRYNTQIITHGRTVCTARRPKCGQCFLSQLCGGKAVGNKND